jgi:hypothetical protein
MAATSCIRCNNAYSIGNPPYSIDSVELGGRGPWTRSRGLVSATWSSGAVHRHLEGRTNGAHPGVGKSAKPADQDRDRHTFDRVQVHGRTARDRVGIGLKNNLAGETPDCRRARCNQCAPKPRDRCVTRQHDDRAPTDLGHFTPPDLPACRKSTHEAPAARRHDARSPHSSGSSAGCTS